MPDCQVIDCDYRKTEKGEYQSFYFPKDPDLRKKWLDSVKRDKFFPTNKSAVCKRHFTEEDFEPVGLDARGRPRKRRTLKDGAVPTLFMGTDHLPKIVDARKTRKSVNGLENDKKKLLKEIKNLKQQNQFKTDIIENQKRTIEQLKNDLNKKEMKDEKKFDELKVEMSSLTASLAKLFTEDQMKKLKFPHKDVRQWADVTLRQCITFYIICGAAAYKFFISKGFPWIPLRTVQHHMQKVNFDCGLLRDLFTLLSYKIEDLEPQHRNFGIVMDEMSIQPKIDFDPGTQSIIGRPTVPLNPKTVARYKAKDPDFDETKTLATHAMNFLICGMCKRIKQIVAWFLTFSSFDPHFIADVMKLIVMECHRINVTISCLTIDMSGQNQKI